MSSTDKRTPERQLVDTILADLREDLPPRTINRSGDDFDRLLAYAQATALARIANALEDMNRYGVDISHRDLLKVYVESP